MAGLSAAVTRAAGKSQRGISKVADVDQRAHRLDLSPTAARISVVPGLRVYLEIRCF